MIFLVQDMVLDMVGKISHGYHDSDMAVALEKLQYSSWGDGVKHITMYTQIV